VDAVIFDCDGTLVDSESLGNEVLVECAAEQGLKMTPAEALRRFRGGRMSDCVAEIEALLGRRLPADFVPELRRRTAVAFRQRLRPVPGALELVRSLRSILAVASSGPREKMELSLSLTGLLPYFAGRIFSAYEIDSWKPDPGLFLHAARTLGVPPSRCAVVEDSLPGVLAGVAAGMTVFALQLEESADPLPAGVRVVGALSELRTLLA
jgi:HAD superfamily hydrolase (TIGR01509 family)